MAPELVRRRATDQRLDVFAFGVMAYEFCTFELPWPRGSDGMAAMTHDRPPADIHKFCPHLQPQLAKAIHSCIEPDMGHRCPSIEAFLRSIKGVQDDRSL
jgi:serine/threonine-protein kinase